MGMKKGLATLGVLTAFVAVGCNPGTPGWASPAAEPVATTAPFSMPVTYDVTGHPLTARSEDPATLAFEAALEMLVNLHRVSLGLGVLQIDPDTKDLARGHSVHMTMHSPAFFDHCNPEGDLPCNRAERAGVPYTSIGENLAAGHPTPEQVFAAWLASPSHRANLESPRWTHMGAGRAYDPVSQYGFYWTLAVIERK